MKQLLLMLLFCCQLAANPLMLSIIERNNAYSRVKSYSCPCFDGQLLQNPIWSLLSSKACSIVVNFVDHRSRTLILELTRSIYCPSLPLGRATYCLEVAIKRSEKTSLPDKVFLPYDCMTDFTAQVSILSSAVAQHVTEYFKQK